jgi:hypothetical protein
MNDLLIFLMVLLRIFVPVLVVGATVIFLVWWWRRCAALLPKPPEVKDFTYFRRVVQAQLVAPPPQKPPTPPSPPPPVWYECDIDLAHINAFSVERKDDNSQSIIGYLLPGADKVREWYLPCTPARHEELVARLAAMRAGRANHS